MTPEEAAGFLELGLALYFVGISLLYVGLLWMILRAIKRRDR